MFGVDDEVDEDLMAKAPRLERRFVRVRRILRFLPKSILVTQVSVESGRTNGTGKIDNQEKKRGGRGKGHTHMRSRHLLIPITNKLVQKMVRKLPWLPYIPPQRHINQISPFIIPIRPAPSPKPHAPQPPLAPLPPRPHPSGLHRTLRPADARIPRRQ